MRVHEPHTLVEWLVAQGSLVPMQGRSRGWGRVALGLITVLAVVLALALRA